ncbi:hypothetical protein B484DRAFT_61136 [Ochromonadaceae sp. CCMP2298]|nr:hypothetical protein B484DRAFT_61136 [Ochromonadaceae sp. CCMP2298]
MVWCGGVCKDSCVVGAVGRSVCLCVCVFVCLYLHCDSTPALCSLPLLTHYPLPPPLPTPSLPTAHIARHRSPPHTYTYTYAPQTTPTPTPPYTHIYTTAHAHTGHHQQHHGLRCPHMDLLPAQGGEGNRLLRRPECRGALSSRHPPPRTPIHPPLHPLPQPIPRPREYVQ